MCNVAKQYTRDNKSFLEKNFSRFTSHFSLKRMNRKAAFTLAEVLITLGIIGVVAAITIPTFIQNYQKHVVETRLKKFYSTMTQAIELAKLDYGEIDYWFPYGGSSEYVKPQEVETDKDGNPVSGQTNAEKFFNKFFAPYIKGTKTELLPDGTFVVYFADGSALRQGLLHPQKVNSWIYYPKVTQTCSFTADYQNAGMSGLTCLGKCCFDFVFASHDGYNNIANKGFNTDKFYWTDGTRDQLTSLCRVYGFSCAALIQYDGWHISKDYPRRIKF